MRKSRALSLFRPVANLRSQVAYSPMKEGSHTVRRALGVGAHLPGCWTTVESRSEERLATCRPEQ